MENETLISDLLPLAIQAHRGTSFDADKRGASLIAEYAKEIAEDIETIDRLAVIFTVSAEQLAEAKTRFVANYREHLSTWLRSKGNCISSMIAGPSRFPVDRATKANRAEHSRYDAFREWRTNAIRAIERTFKPAVTAATEVERYEQKLAGLQENQAMMKLANQIIRKSGPDRVAKLIEAGFSPEHAHEITTPDVFGGIGFQPYSLSNNLAQIKATEIQLAKAKSRQTEIDNGNAVEEIEIGGTRVVLNRESNRLQIFFPGKPDRDMIDALKKNAFKWAPSVSAWQRQLTGNALFAAKQILVVP